MIIISDIQTTGSHHGPKIATNTQHSIGTLFLYSSSLLSCSRYVCIFVCICTYVLVGLLYACIQVCISLFEWNLVRISLRR